MYIQNARFVPSIAPCLSFTVVKITDGSLFMKSTAVEIISGSPFVKSAAVEYYLGRLLYVIYAHKTY